MNTKTITFCVFAALFMGAAVFLDINSQSNLDCWLLCVAMVFVLAALTCAAADLILAVRHDELLKSKRKLQAEIKQLEDKKDNFEKEIKKIEDKNKELADMGVERIKQLEQKNKELQKQLTKVCEIPQRLDLIESAIRIMAASRSSVEPTVSPTE